MSVFEFILVGVILRYSMRKMDQAKNELEKIIAAIFMNFSGILMILGVIIMVIK